MLLLTYRQKFVAILLVCTLLYPQTTKPTVAVLDFEGRGVSEQETFTLTDRLISELGNTGAITLVERKLLDRIMEEQGLQQTGCTTDDCVAEVGKLLGVQFMISGSINKLGDVFTIDAKMFSVETGEAIRTVSKTYRGEIDGLIPEIESLAWEIVGLDRQKKITTAILDFEGRGISQLEAATLTDRFRSELGNTNVVQLVARQEMNEVLGEQGFEQKEECTTVECAAEVGALLGVEQIINGSVGKIGNTYTIDAQMINVGTGATLKTVSQTYRGEVDGLITEIEILAWNIVELEVPKRLREKRRLGTKVFLEQQASAVIKTRTGALIRSIVFPGLGQFYMEKQKWAYGWAVSELVVGGLILYSYNQYQKAYDDYNLNMDLYRQETDTEKIAEYRAKVQSSDDEIDAANNQIKLLSGLAAGVWIANAVHAYLVGPKSGSQANTNTSIQFAYNPQLQHSQMKLYIALN